MAHLVPFELALRKEAADSLGRQMAHEEAVTQLAEQAGELLAKEAGISSLLTRGMGTLRAVSRGTRNLFRTTQVGKGVATSAAKSAPASGVIRRQAGKVVGSAERGGSRGVQASVGRVQAAPRSAPQVENVSQHGRGSMPEPAASASPTLQASIAQPAGNPYRTSAPPAGAPQPVGRVRPAAQQSPGRVKPAPKQKGKGQQKAKEQPQQAPQQQAAQPTAVQQQTSRGILPTMWRWRAPLAMGGLGLGAYGLYQGAGIAARQLEQTSNTPMAYSQGWSPVPYGYGHTPYGQGTPTTGYGG